MAIRILVVDDATFIRDMVKKHLRERLHGAEVFDAPDGNRAMTQIKAQPIDLILSDWEMPGMTGEELLHWVRTHESYSKLPFIMVTSRGDRDHVLKAVQAGVSDFISKPFTPDELLKKVQKQLKKTGKLNASGLSKVRSAGATQGVAYASVDILTGGARQDKKEARPAKSAKNNVKGKAQLRFPGSQCTCVIRELSLQMLSGLIQRDDHVPALFEQAVIDIENDSDSIARINGYVHSVQAGENRADSHVIKIVIRFVDNDPEKFGVLSQFIAKHP